MNDPNGDDFVARVKEVRRGRQARPANDVGRPHRRPNSTSVDGRRAFLAGWKAAAAEADEIRGLPPFPPEKILDAWYTYYAAESRLAREARKRLRGSEAPHGETAPDAPEVGS